MGTLGLPAVHGCAGRLLHLLRLELLREAARFPWKQPSNERCNRPGWVFKPSAARYCRGPGGEVKPRARTRASRATDVRFWGVKRTLRGHALISAFDI